MKRRKRNGFHKEHAMIVLLGISIVVLLALIYLLIRRESRRAGSQEIIETGVTQAAAENDFNVNTEQQPPEAVEEEPVVSAIHATVWPTKMLEVFSDTDRKTVIGAAYIGKALCVLEEKDGMFRVRAQGGEGYIDSNACMINLPDYLGSFCAYDITNAYDSIYLVHDLAIPQVSGTVVAGYENVLLNDGTFLVPLLYPVAKKLAPAAQRVYAEGYRLKIYDAFRPYVATRSIYDLTAEILYLPVPEEPFSRITPAEYLAYGDRALWADWDTQAAMQAAIAALSEENTEAEVTGAEDRARISEVAIQNPVPEPAVQEAGMEEAVPAVDQMPDDGQENVPEAGSEDPQMISALHTMIEEALATGVLQEELVALLPEGTMIYDEEGQMLPHVQEWLQLLLESTRPAEPKIPYEQTYHYLMTNGGSYHLGSFLAASGSTHNYGIAVDITLERRSDGRELSAQTAMHDLSWYSAMSRNNDNANLLKEYLVPEGFATIGSEWWHFQDNETRQAVRPVSVREGFSVEGWKRDDRGWRYRQADGSFHCNELKLIDDVTYTFDAEGYAQEVPLEN